MERVIGHKEASDLEKRLSVDGTVNIFTAVIHPSVQ